MKETALIVFAKNPVLGKVKTRLAQDIGPSGALSVYLNLLKHTKSCLLNLLADIHIFYDQTPSDLTFWDPLAIKTDLQTPTPDLGLRMHDAIVKLAALSYKNVILIGTDCPALEPFHLQNAAAALHKNSVVVGPALDGGYYLIGLNISTISNPKALLNKLFIDKTWSHPQVFQELLLALKYFEIEPMLLPTLSDLDNLSDLENFKYLGP